MTSDEDDEQEVQGIMNEPISQPSQSQPSAKTRAKPRQVIRQDSPLDDALIDNENTDHDDAQSPRLNGGHRHSSSPLSSIASVSREGSLARMEDVTLAKGKRARSADINDPGSGDAQNDDLADEHQTPEPLEMIIRRKRVRH